MKRLLYRSSILILAMLSVAIALMWLRSYWRFDRIQVRNYSALSAVSMPPTEIMFTSSKGGMLIGATWAPEPVQDSEIQRLAGLHFPSKEWECGPATESITRYVNDSYTLTYYHEEDTLISGRGARLRIVAMEAALAQEAQRRRLASAGWWRRLGFAQDSCGSQTAFAFYNTRTFTFPYWIVLLPLVALPTIAFSRFYRRRSRSTHQLCLNCGYDLRASVARCPECGKVGKELGVGTAKGSGVNS